MLRAAAITLTLALGLPATRCTDVMDPKQSGPQSKAIDPVEEEYKALCAELLRPPPMSAPANDEERIKYIGLGYRRVYEMAAKFVDLARRNPGHPLALDALTKAVWQVNTTPWPVENIGHDAARAQAFELLQRDHIQSSRLATICGRIGNGFAKEYDNFYRAILLKNPHRDVRGAACVWLAHFISIRMQKVDLCRESAVSAADFSALYGKEYLDGLLARDRVDVEREIVELLDMAQKSYADVVLPDGATVAVRARAELYELQNLSVGKRAPDIEGIDQDGVQFKLSDYRGNVIFLDFWSYV
ncbi:MAG: hypothetical protein HY286_12250 [Planctomycetes bacterium]|nr:hypothetical protein [Planctomycetota bacterium]